MNAETPEKISDNKYIKTIYRYDRAIVHIILLRSMAEISDAEVKRLISLLKSSDPENWQIAELAIEKKLL